MSRKIVLWMIVIAFFVGAIGSITMSRFLFPYFSNFKGLGWLTKLSTNSPIVVSKLEQVQLNDGANLVDLAKQAGSITVGIYQDGNFLGNGIIVTSDGLIFTDSSVVGSGKDLMVVLNDGRIFPAQVRATDPKSSLAVITITAQNLEVASFDDASGLQTGQRVFAVGRANTAFVHKFKTGFVTTSVNNSANGALISTASFADTVGTDLNLDHDLTGGPILDLQGRVVAMATASNPLLSEYIQTALSVYLASGKITRPFLGIKYLNVTPTTAKLMGLDHTGALVKGFELSSPAAGLQVNDLIISVDGQNLDRMDLEQALNHHAISEMKLTVLRGKQSMDVTVKLQER